ncbi:DUF2062 domain-containing protein [Paenibacillus gansuensis]|uniref:DUF2062 domain-containing protein n=1 Tax=Paenibacillus gansuensis TaxID=306542 RepID=A0ABW5PE78_9BACL
MKTRFMQMMRWFKYKYLMLLRAKGGPAMVATGFSIGIAVEMFTLPTFGLAFFLIFPLNYLLRGSLAGALIGFVIGKVIYIPIAFMNSKVGGMIVPKHLEADIAFLPQWIEKLLFVNLKLIVGGMIVGAVMGILLYFPVRWLLQYFTHRRKEKRKHRKATVLMTATDI